MVLSMEGKVVIITGGASGLGYEACKVFAKQGANVVVVDYNKLGAERVAKELIEAGYPAALAFGVDVKDRDQVSKMVYDVVVNFGKIDVLINNAGITRDRTAIKMSQDEWETVIDTNLTGVFNCTKEVLPYMVEQGKGRIISTSSVVGTNGGFGQINYAASKAGIIGMTKSLAKELGRKGITANAVAPGFILTPMVEAMPEKVLKQMESGVSVGRLGKPVEVAHAYLYLASDEAAYVNGTVLEIDGGIIF